MIGNSGSYLPGPQSLFHPVKGPSYAPHFKFAQIEWERLAAKRHMVLYTIAALPVYLLTLEAFLYGAKKHQKYPLILELMCAICARDSEVMALTPSASMGDSCDFGVVLKTLKLWQSQLTNAVLRCSPKRFIPIVDHSPKDRIQNFLYMVYFRKTELAFSMWRQVMNRNIHVLVERTGCVFIAIHLMLNGRLLKYASQLLGYKLVDRTGVYTNAVSADRAQFLVEVDFHQMSAYDPKRIVDRYLVV
ncbi:site-specific integrase [Pseudomaricurvus alkylphenolicus]|uniref:site-specific integrase n=1 Tax=Pseudomaricurvus alkylphenolicus TaxID=1306991 RepID=UPI00141E3E43|nr:site-specific integrase [Pseudomaricurvus alkylphenolicus]NIB44041.1 site-specific integrase [Pseudomaricurvus alkylphenolicus]